MREDFGSFCLMAEKDYEINWHHEILIQKLGAVEKGQIKKLMICMPPRHGKSETASYLFPAWYIGRHPDKEIITASYGSSLAYDFGRKVRNLITQEEFKLPFPGVLLAEDSTAKGRWHTNKGGGYIATGVGGAMTGYGCDILLIDDPIKNREEANSEVFREKVWDWYRSTAYTRLQPNGSVILIQTRWHEDDLAGRILKMESDWEVVTFPAIAEVDEKYRKQGEALWPKRYSVADLMKIKASLGPYEWSALYQQQPTNLDSQEFKREWIKYYDVVPQNVLYFTTVDPAISEKNSADSSCIMTCAVDEFNRKYVVGYTVGKFNPSELIEHIFRHALKYKPERVGIEAIAYQQAIYHFVKDEMFKRNQWFEVEEMKSQGNKEVRIRGLIPHFSNGAVYFARGMVDLEQQMFSFPVGAHDDILDALSMQLPLWLQSAPASNEPTNPYADDPNSPWNKNSTSKGYTDIYSYK